MRPTLSREVGYPEQEWILRSMFLNAGSGFETTVEACPARKRLSGCYPLAAVTRHSESIGASGASGGSPGLPSQRRSHSPRALSRTNR